MRMHRAVGQCQLDARGARLLARPPRIALDDAEVVGLGGGDADDDRVDHRDRRQQRALASSDEAAGLHQRRADQPVDRRRDPHVAEIEPGLVRRSLGRVDLRPRGVDLRPRGVLEGARVVELLLTDGLLRDQRRARDVVVGLIESRPGRRQIGFVCASVAWAASDRSDRGDRLCERTIPRGSSRCRSLDSPGCRRPGILSARRVRYRRLLDDGGDVGFGGSGGVTATGFYTPC